MELHLSEAMQADLLKFAEACALASASMEDYAQGLADYLLDTAAKAILDDLFNTPHWQAVLRANERFGQRVTRANRHKWRRCYLLERQMGAPT